MNRQMLVRICTFLGGLYFFLEYLLPEKIGSFQFSAYNDQIVQGIQTVTAMAFGLGLINILYIHGSRVVFARKGWINSLGLLFGLIAMFVITLREWRGSMQASAEAKPFGMLAQFATVIESDAKSGKVDQLKSLDRILLLQSEVEKAIQALETRPWLPKQLSLLDYQQYQSSESKLDEALKQLRLTAVDPTSTALYAAGLRNVALFVQEQAQMRFRFSADALIYKMFYEGLFIALGSAMFALLGFYMAAAAYRAFRVQSFESALMMSAAIIVMLGQIPFGLWIWDGFTELRLWLLSTPSTAAFRAVKFGAAVAGLVMAFRMWLSIETDSFSGKAGGGK